MKKLPITGKYAQGGLTIFYGKPDGSEMEIEDLKGVVFLVVNSSTTANASGTYNINFPSGKVRIKGLFVLGIHKVR